jgi:hypothetical protein
VVLSDQEVQQFLSVLVSAAKSRRSGRSGRGGRFASRRVSPRRPRRHSSSSSVSSSSSSSLSLSSQFAYFPQKSIFIFVEKIPPHKKRTKNSKFNKKKNGWGQRPKVSESERESAGESGESRRREHVECVSLSLSLFTCTYMFFSLFLTQNRSCVNQFSLRILSLLFSPRVNSFTDGCGMYPFLMIKTESNEAAKSIQCKVCMQAFVSTLSHGELRKHAENKHPKLDAKQCFPFLE